MRTASAVASAPRAVWSPIDRNPSRRLRNAAATACRATVSSAGVVIARRMSLSRATGTGSARAAVTNARVAATDVNGVSPVNVFSASRSAIGRRSARASATWRWSVARFARLSAPSTSSASVA